MEAPAVALPTFFTETVMVIVSKFVGLAGVNVRLLITRSGSGGGAAIIMPETEKIKAKRTVETTQ